MRTLFVILLAMTFSACAPLINDITTDTSDPPRIAVVKSGQVTDKYYPYPENFVSRQEAAYPDIQPRQYKIDLSKASQLIQEVLSEGEIVSRNETGELSIQAVFITPLLRFRDDVVVRIRRQQVDQGKAEGVVVDIRSRSRLGTGDLGTNAKRIRVILAEFEERLRSR